MSDEKRGNKYEKAKVNGIWGILTFGILDPDDPDGEARLTISGDILDDLVDSANALHASGLTPTQLAAVPKLIEAAEAYALGHDTDCASAMERRGRPCRCGWLEFEAALDAVKGEAGAEQAS